MKIAIMYADVSAGSGKDDLDVLTQLEAVRKALLDLGHQTFLLPVTLNLQKIEADLGRMKPDTVFNLVESLGGTGRFIHFAPALLERLSVPFTGAGSESLYVTTGKIRTKERLRRFGIATPDWAEARGGDSAPEIDGGPPYIVKPVWEDASVGLDDASVVHSREDLPGVFRDKARRHGACFVESFIDGREFNVSLLGWNGGVRVLPPAEILFDAFPAGKPRIVGYDAKWEEDSFEYRNTPRNFEFPANQASLLKELEALSRRCWEIFDLRGYARVDFRVDREARPWVIEVNANPCIAPDAGFTAALKRAGISYRRMVECILESAVPC